MSRSVLLLLLLALPEIAAQCEIGSYQTVHYGFSHVNGTGNKFQYMKNEGRTNSRDRVDVKADKAKKGVLQTTVNMGAVISWVAGLNIQSDSSAFMVGLDNGKVELVTVALNGTSRVQARRSGATYTFPNLWLAFTAKALRTSTCSCYSANGPPRVVHDITYSVVGADGAIDVSDESHPVPACPAQSFETAAVYVNNDGNVVLWDKTAQVAMLSGLDALRDARIVRSDEGLFAVYTQRTFSRYRHGILGNLYEAAGMHVFEVTGCGTGQLSLVSKSDLTLPGNQVFEGVSPLWAYVPTDKEFENAGPMKLVTTVSETNSGAKLAVYTAEPLQQALESPSIGSNATWRHQLMHGNFGDECESGFRVVDLKQPHSAYTLEFFEPSGSALGLKESRPGYSTHYVHNQNLDMAAGGDFDGDGNPEVVLFDQTFNKVAAVSIKAGAAEEVWSFDIQGLGGSAKLVTSNVAVVDIYNREKVIESCTKEKFEEAAGEVVARSLAFGAGSNLNVISTNRDSDPITDGQMEPLPVAYASQKLDLCGAAPRTQGGLLGLAAALLLVGLQAVWSM